MSLIKTALWPAHGLLGVSLAALVTFHAGDARASDKLDDMVRDWQVRHDLIGLSAACASDGRLVAASSGTSDDAGAVPLDPTFRFQIGSVAKTFTAATVLSLVEDGLLSLDDPLSRWYPDYPNATDITIKHLLDMTAGTFDYFRADPGNPVIGMVMQDIHRHWTPEEVIAIAATQPPHASPGEAYWYSNTNFLLLGRIVEVVTGAPLAEALRERAFVPAQLSSTGLVGTADPDAPEAWGYLRGSAFLFDREAPFFAGPDAVDGLATLGWAAGGMTATAADLAVWGEALFGGAVMSRDLLARMLDPSPQSVAAGSAYGLGIELFETGLGPAFGHAGSIPGYAAVLMYFPATGYSVAVLTNDEAGEPLLAGFSTDIAEQACAN